MSQNIFSRLDFTVKAGESKNWSSAYGMWPKKMTRSIMLYAFTVKGIKGQSILETCWSSVCVGRLGDLGSAVSTKNEEKHSQVMGQGQWVKINDFYLS